MAVPRSECETPEQERVHPGCGDGGRVSRRQLQPVVPTGGLDSAVKV